jgi:hypothetical protein
MAVSPEDLAAGAIALQVFVKNAQYVEIIVGVAFATIPTILGLGAAGLLGSGIINTAKEVRNSISLLKTVGPGIQAGWMAWKVRRETAERWLQSDNKLKQYGTFPLAPVLFIKSRLKKNQDTQGKQEEKGSGGGGGSPPPPPDIKSDKKEQNNKEEKPRPIEPSYGFSDSLLGEIFKRDNK